jgi:hypothetical protein
VKYFTLIYRKPVLSRNIFRNLAATPSGHQYPSSLTTTTCAHPAQPPCPLPPPCPTTAKQHLLCDRAMLKFQIRHFDVEQESQIFSFSQGNHFTASRSGRTHSGLNSQCCLGRGGACLNTQCHTYIFYLLVPENQLEKASQTLTSLLPEYAVTDPRNNYTDGWLLMPREDVSRAGLICNESAR